MAESERDRTVVVIGSGFGGTMTALAVARALEKRNQREGRHDSVLILERGAWWTTPAPTVQDPDVATYKFLAEDHKQPVHYWASAESFRGLIDLYTRCFRRWRNEDGLYDLVTFGKRGLFGMLKGDGVSIMRASGVGGGSLVYSNITIKPPDFIFEDPRWPTGTTWYHDGKRHSDYFELARRAIGDGILLALWERDNPQGSAGSDPKPGAVNTGLSNIVTRSTGLAANWRQPPTVPGALQLDPAAKQPPVDELWIDRARIFQREMSKLTDDYGTVDSSINDKATVGDPPAARNYCERHGRCNVGRLPGARHTLNKQLMRAIYGGLHNRPPEMPALSLEPLTEVELIEKLDDGGYRIHYRRRRADKPWRSQAATVTADTVIVAAGCVGTTELMLQCKEADSIPGLSDCVGASFSTNGDYLDFLPKTKSPVSLTRGPVTTSFAHFNTPEHRDDADLSKFHTIEDQGIPRALASVVGAGAPLLRSLSKGRRKPLWIVWTITRYARKRLGEYVRAPFRNRDERQLQLASEDEQVMNMMCIAAMGRERSTGRLRLGRGWRDTTLRAERRNDGGEPERFEDDPIYDEIRASLGRFAEALRPEGDKAEFENPFLTGLGQLFGGRSIALTHPLGGCRMGHSPEYGVVDEFGRVFDKRADDGKSVHRGLYIADASIIPTALAVNPSLTISALALRTADTVIDDLGAAAKPTNAATAHGGR